MVFKYYSKAMNFSSSSFEKLNQSLDEMAMIAHNLLMYLFWNCSMILSSSLATLRVDSFSVEVLEGEEISVFVGWVELSFDTEVLVNLSTNPLKLQADGPDNSPMFWATMFQACENS
jgi:hypothetical protein